MTTTVTSVSSTTSSTALIAADGSRSSLVIENTDGGRLYCLLVDSTGTATTSPGGFTFSLVENGTATLTAPDSYKAVYGIWASDGSGGATITAITDAASDSNNAFSTFGGLKTAIAAWLRPNSAISADMTAQMPVYVGLAEAVIRRDLHGCVLDQTEASLTITDGAATVPTGLQAVMSMVMTTAPYNQIRALPIDQLDKLDPTQVGDKPYYYARTGSTFRFYPRTSGTAQLRYRRGVTPLSADADTNWVLQAHPDIYLFASLVQAGARLIDPRRTEWQAMYVQSLESAKALERMLHSDAIYPQPSGFVV